MTGVFLNTVGFADMQQSTTHTGHDAITNRPCIVIIPGAVPAYGIDASQLVALAPLWLARRIWGIAFNNYFAHTQYLIARHVPLRGYAGSILYTPRSVTELWYVAQYAAPALHRRQHRAPRRAGALRV